MHTVLGENATQLWENAFQLVRNHGHGRASRNGPTLEKQGVALSLMTADEGWCTSALRQPSLVYACAELLWYLSGDPSGAMITAYASHYRDFLEDSGEAFGAYGARWARHDQINRVIEVLRRDPKSRQAVVTMWDAGTDLEHAVARDRRDLPCTLSMQFLLDGERLNCITTMRSNDVWLGLPYDLFCFTAVQRLVAAALGVPTGWYNHCVGSLHLYTKDLDGRPELTTPSRHVALCVPEPQRIDDLPGEIDRALQIERAARRRGEVLSSNLRSSVLDVAANITRAEWVPRARGFLRRSMHDYHVLAATRSMERRDIKRRTSDAQ